MNIVSANVPDHPVLTVKVRAEAPDDEDDEDGGPEEGSEPISEKEGDAEPLRFAS